MAGTVYLRTNKFEVKLEGITFKAEDFESICTTDFLFPEGKKVRLSQQPVVGIDVMRHPRDPFIVLVLLCFGVGCMILRFNSGDPLPQSIVKFLKDERIRFVGFGIPEKRDLFPFEELGLVKTKADIGYVASKVLNDPKYKSSELSELARKVLSVSEMVGLTAASSFERHEQIKCAICQLFLSTVIAMTLLRMEHNKKVAGSPKKFADVSPKKKILGSPKNGRKKKFVDAAKIISCLKSMNSMSLLNEGLFKLSKGMNNKHEKSKVVEKNEDFCVQKQARIKEPAFSDDSFDMKGKEGSSKGKNDNKNAKVFERSISVKEPTFCDDFDDKTGKNENKNPKVFERSTSLKEPAFSDDFKGEESFSKGKNENKNLKVFERSISMKEPTFCDDFDEKTGKEGSSGDESVNGKGKEDLTKKPLKGILKCPSTGLENFNSPPKQPCTPPSTPMEQQNGDNAAYLKRANSKGCNVSFNFKQY